MPDSVNIDIDALALLGASQVAGYVSDQYEQYIADDDIEWTGSPQFNDADEVMLFPEDHESVVEEFFQSGGIADWDELDDLSDAVKEEVSLRAFDTYYEVLKREQDWTRDGMSPREIFVDELSRTHTGLWGDYEEHLSEVGRDATAESACKMDTNLFLGQLDLMLERYEFHYHAQKGWNLNATRRMIWALEDVRRHMRGYFNFIHRSKTYDKLSDDDFRYDFSEERMELKPVADYLAERSSR